MTFDHNTKKSVKVAVIIDSIKKGGGAERNAVRLATLMHREGYEVSVLTFSTHKDEYPYEYNRTSLFEGRQRLLPFKFVKAVARIVKLRHFYRENGITHVISFLDKANTYTILSRVLLSNKPRLIISVRANPFFVKRVKRMMIKILYRFADVVVGVSKDMEVILKNDFHLKSVITIYNPIDLNFTKEQIQQPLLQQYLFLKTNKNRPIFINIGRLSDQKGQTHLIKSFSLLKKDYPNALLIIIGEGEKRYVLEEMLRKYNLTDDVLLVGKQDNIYPFLNVADCFVFPSLYEGFPNALLEAAASGLYIISADCKTGPREILAPEKLNCEISYPYRVAGASLLSDVGDTESEEVFEVNLYKEMLWFAKEKYDTDEHVDVGRFSNEVFLEQWVSLLKS